MSTLRRSALLKLSASAYEIGLDVHNGVLARDESGRWRLGELDLVAWLAQYEGQELVLILGSLVDDRPLETRTCRTCGRDYTEAECPTCRANRIRLRGHP